MNICWIIMLYSGVILSVAFSAHGCSVHHKRRGESAELQFRATIVNPVEPAFAVSNVIKSPNDSTLLSALYTNGKLSNIPVCNGCNLTGGAETGNLTVRLDNLQEFNGGTYKLEVNGKDKTESCITLIVLDVPTKPTLTPNKDPSVGESVTLTCSSTSRTSPSNHGLILTYTWRVDGTDNPSGSRYSYSTYRKTLTLHNVVKADARKRFTCTATENVTEGYTSSSSDSFSPNVLYGPEELTFDPPYANYIKEGNQTLGPVTCESVCNPPCTFTWKNVDKETVVSRESTLSLDLLTSLDAGTYQCIASRSGTNFLTKNLTVNVIYTTVQSFYIEQQTGQDHVTVDEHDAQIDFKCVVNSNTASTTKVMFEGAILKEGVNVTSLSFTRQGISCYDAGAYTCEGTNEYGGKSNKTLFLFVRCVPRPKGQIRRNLTSELLSSITLSFTAIAYPEPGSKGFAWQKEEIVGWVPLLSNDHLKISSSGLQSYLTVLNVSNEDYGNYRVTVTNNIGNYVQHFFLSEETSAHQTDSQCKCQNSDQAALIVGISLGLVCCVLASVAIYLGISRMRTVTKETRLQSKTKKQSAYASTSFASEVVERQEYENSATGQGESFSQSQYTDLYRYANTDKDTYDVIKKE